MISLIHATARIAPTPALPEGWREAYRRWHETCEEPDRVEYVLVFHRSRWEAGLRSLPRPSLWPQERIIYNPRRDCCVDQGEAGFQAAIGDLFVVLHDDMFPSPGWDRLLREALPDFQQEAVIRCSTGHPNDQVLFNPQIFTRARWQAVGPDSLQEYESMFSDREFTDRARLDGVVVEATHLRFEHRHPDFGNPTDAVYALENRPEAYAVGREVYDRHRAAGFKPGAYHARIQPTDPA